MLEQGRAEKGAKRDPQRRAQGSRAVVEAVTEAGPATNDLAIAHALVPTASAQERVNTFLGLGLSVEELSLAVGVAENTIRNWSDGSAQPRRAADQALDDLRMVVLTLDEKGVEAARTVNWLRSRNRAWLSNERPLDLLRTDPLLLFAAAEDPDQSADTKGALRPGDGCRADVGTARVPQGTRPRSAPPGRWPGRAGDERPVHT
jgi:Protein of unknown function (DUF2384)